MATIDDVRTVLGDVLQLGGRGDSLTAETPLLGGLPELDSIAVVDVISALEDRFGIVIDDDELDASIFSTLGSLSEFCSAKLQS